MKRVLVVTAVELEARALARQLGLARAGGPDWPHFHGGALELVCAGPRAAHLSLRALGVAPGTIVISAGVCGALSPDLAEGDLVVPEAVVSPGAERRATAALPPLRRAGTLVTVDAVVEPDGRLRTARAVRVVLSRPRAIADAMALRSATTAALKSVAAALAKLARG